MNRYTLYLAKELIGCIARRDIQGQYTLANEIALDALASGAKGPTAEDAIEEARR